MNYFSKVLDFKEHVPPSVKEALKKIGNQQIVSARCGRTPVQSVIQGALRMVATVPYDNLFHLFIELKLANNQIWVLEKIERINLVREIEVKKKVQNLHHLFQLIRLLMNYFKILGTRWEIVFCHINQHQIIVRSSLWAF